MANRIIKQPDGYYARFSEIVDDFTHYNYTSQGILDVYIEEYSVNEDVARSKLINAEENPDRFEEAMMLICSAHGKEIELQRRQELS